MRLKVGQLVFRVDGSYGGGGVSVGIETRQIAHVTALKIKLDKPFPFTVTSGLLDKRVIGRVFYLSAKEALCAYAREQSNEMTRAATRIENCRANLQQLYALAITATEAPELLPGPKSKDTQ